uniref:Ig-like domain-containing protein n=1 Tax=Globodera pallida TaxID=36090 RepID=A0A183CEW8_GLOPA
MSSQHPFSRTHFHVKRESNGTAASIRSPNEQRMATSITTSNSTSADNEEGPSRPAKTARRTSVANLTNRFESRGAKSSILTELSQTTMRVNSPPRRKKALLDQEFAPEAQPFMSTEDANGRTPTMIQVGRKKPSQAAAAISDQAEEYREASQLKRNSMQRLQGIQVGKKRVEHEFQQVQLKKAAKVKKEEQKEGLEAVDLRHMSEPRHSLSPRPDDVQMLKRDSLRTPVAELRESTELDQYRRGSIRRRSSVDMRRESFAEMLDKPQVPLKDLGTSGTPARIVEIPENVTVVEGEMAIMKCVVEGNPAPTFVWKKGGREVPLTGRVRCQTDGDTGQVSLIIGKCRPQDEDEYTLAVKNAHGKEEVGAKLLSNLDFRATLKKRGHQHSVSER